MLRIMEVSLIMQMLYQDGSGRNNMFCMAGFSTFLGHCWNVRYQYSSFQQFKKLYVIVKYYDGNFYHIALTPVEKYIFLDTGSISRE